MLAVQHAVPDSKAAGYSKHACPAWVSTEQHAQLVLAVSPCMCTGCGEALCDSVELSYAGASSPSQCRDCQVEDGTISS